MGNFVGARNGVLGRRSRRWRPTAVTTVVAVLAATLVMLQPAVRAEAAGSPCGANINPIVCENQKTGTDPDVWDIDGAGDDSIQGFATDISVNAGSTIDFKIDTDAADYDIDIYRTGWYQGKGARFIHSVTPSAQLPQVQPECISDVTTELYDCGTWGVSASWNVPAAAVSGVYVAKLTLANGDTSHITFIVRKDGNTSDVLFQTSDPTWHAYNSYGGSNFYQGAANGRAYKISYNRPFATRNGVAARDFYFSSEYATVRFLERNGYDMSYIAGVDTDRRGAELLNHKVFLSVGHDEYWSGAQRKNIEAARDAGVNLQFLTGNEGYWRTRYEPSVGGASTNYRTLVSYKETWGNSANRYGAKIDSSSPEWTGTWRDPRFATASQGGGSPENALTGTMYQVNNVYLPVTVDSEEGKSRLWRNTSLASLPTGTTAQLADQTVGYESNEDVANGFRPAGLIRLSTTVGATPEYLTDYGNTVVAGSTTHHVTLYRAASGALVFSAASVQWSWGLDSEHDGTDVPADSRMQQAQVNLLADMGVQPGTLMSGLSAAIRSTDTTAPTTVIVSPAGSSSFAHGSVVAVTGTAADVGGRVAGVEVSTDGGTTWHPAQGRTNWTYSYIQQGAGAQTIFARAIDDSANYAPAGVSRAITVTGPSSVFGAEVPETASANDAGSIELGLRFSPESDGFVTGVRFFKGATNRGAHTGSLWDANGSRLASVAFSNETATGWQTAEFLNPVQVSAGMQYTVSYSAPSGGYSMTNSYWPYKSRSTSPVIVSAAVGTQTAGVFGSIGAWPRETYQESNYFVDVVFDKADTSPLRLASRTPRADASSIALNADVSATFTRNANPTTVSIVVKDSQGGSVPGTVSYVESTRTVRFVPAQPFAPSTKHTVTLTAADTEGVQLVAGSGWSFTTQAADLSAGDCPCSLFQESDRPVFDSDPDSALVTLGVRFTVEAPGQITALKFFKGDRNGGPRAVTLWKADGTALATAPVTTESSHGWQTVVLSQPIDVVPGVTYVASYVAPQGGYSVSPGQFGTGGYTRGPLSVPANGGAFTYSTGFPAETSATNYSVDVTFQPDEAAPTATTRTPAIGATDVAAGTTISVTFSEAITAQHVGKVLANGSAVAGTWSLSGDRKTLTFDPAGLLPAGATVSVEVTDVVGLTGVSGDGVAWSFSVMATGQTVTSLFADEVPQVPADPSDTASIELGTAFRSSVAGTVRAIRFYKGEGNNGVHVGALWSPTGSRLAQVTFIGETASGWQRALLDNPVAIQPGLVYTVTYVAPQGRYSYTNGALATPITKGPLTTEAPANGRYRYGSGDVMPQDSWNSTNYFVDVEFVTDTTAPGAPPAVASVTPARDAVGVATDSAINATVERVPADKQVSLKVTGATGVVPGTSSFAAGAGRVTFTPSRDLDSSTLYTALLTLDGQALDSWSFRTASRPVDGQAETLFGAAVPAIESSTDTEPVEVGTAFHVSSPGAVTALRFYKGRENIGTHRGTLWAEDGSILARVTFAGESASGWQRAELDEPVNIVPGVTYIASYYTPQGRFAIAPQYFASEQVSGRITAPAIENGRFFYGLDGGFPTGSWGASAYYVDAEVAFPVASPSPSATSTPLPSTSPSATPTPTPPPAVNPTITSTSPSASATNVSPSSAVISATLSHAASATIALAKGAENVAGTSSFDAVTGVVTFAPAGPLARGATYAVTVTAGGAPVPGGSWTFATTPHPALSATSPAAGSTGVDPVTARISATLTNAASASLAVTSAGVAVGGTSGYDASTGVVTFTAGAALARGTTYLVTVTAEGQPLSGGTWSFTTLANPAIVATTPAPAATRIVPGSPITATITNASTAAIKLTTNGANVAGSSSFNAASGVVTFTPTARLAWNRTYSVTATANGAALAGGTWSFTTVPQATRSAVTPSSGATTVNPATAKVTATLTNAVTATLTVKQGSVDVPGTAVLNTETRIITFTPTVQLDWAKTFTATVTANGAAVTNGTWSFTTIAKPDQIALFTTGTPTSSNANAGSAYQAGTRFTSSAAGVVTTIRFYKGSLNTGTHTGYLRTASGTVLAQATFINETASGWQKVVLSTPVRLTVGAEYRVTVHSTSGRYALTTSGLATTVTSGPLSSIGGIAGAGTANPTTTSTNKFWVDVVFDPDN